MSVESTVDAYLQMAKTILGDPASTPTPTSPPPPVAQLPHPDWLGDAAHSAEATGRALTQARVQLTSAAADVGAATTTAAQISRDANLQLQGIINDWGAAKATLAGTPQPLRDSGLIEAGQLHIAEAMTLISATTDQFNAAAAGVSTTTSSLPPPTPSPAHPPSGAAAPGDPAADMPESGSAGTDQLSAPLPGAGAPTPPAATTAASSMPAETPLSAAAAGAMPAMMSALPAAMSPMQNTAPMPGPMASMVPAAASPLASLSGLASQLGDPAPHTTPTTDNPDGPLRRSTPGSVDAAIDAALDALGINDPAARARWHAGYDTLIARESAGRVHAVNRTDSNAHGALQSDGAPAGSSRGLTQLVPETFRRYRLPALSSDIYDPVSNIAASMRYVMDRHHVDPSGINLATNVQQANPRARARGY